MATPLNEQTMDTFLDGVQAIAANPMAPKGLTHWVEFAKIELKAMMRGSISPNKSPYAPLSPVTIKLTPGRKGGPLINTGDMMESLVGQGDGHIESVGESEAILGTGHSKEGLPVAMWHQDGTKRMPARPFVGFNEQMIDDAMNLVADDLLAQVDMI